MTALLPAPPAFEPAAPAALREVGTSDGDEPGWRIEEDVLAGTVTVDDRRTAEPASPRTARRVYSAEHLRLTASDADPAHARLAADVVYRWTVDGADIDIRATGSIASDAEAFDVRGRAGRQARRGAVLRARVARADPEAASSSGHQVSEASAAWPTSALATATATLASVPSR